MAEAGASRPLIVKRKKITAGGGHHGGAWKVAYADFVTAMMAFFLLLWLVNVTTEEQRKGIADYFSPAARISRESSGGDGMFGGHDMSTTETGLHNRLEETPSPEAAERAALAAAEQAALSGMVDRLLGRSGESARMDELLQHVVTRLTDEGLIVEIFVRPGAPIFVEGGSEPTPVLREIIAVVVELAEMVTNEIAVGAHLPARSVVLADNPVWELSSARADSVRRMLKEEGLDPARVARVTGHADREPRVQDPAAPRNDRVEIIFLRRH